METAAAAGGSGTVSIDLARDCAWTASSGAAWVVLTSASSGQGGGTIAYQVAANPDSVARRTTIDVNDVKATINQDAAACRYVVTPLAHDVATAGGTLTVTVQTQVSCEWTAASEAAWIAISAGGKGKGDGAVTLAVDASSGAARSGTIRVAGQTVAVTQSAVPCTYKVTPPAGSMASAGGTATATVSAPAHCAWTAASSVPWMTIASSAAGIGNGLVQLAIAANPGAGRTGSATVATQTFSISQAPAPCTFAVAPTTVALPVAGGDRSVTVTTRGDCAWTAGSNVPWISVTAGASSTGSGTVAFNVGANIGDARSGGLTIGGQPVTVAQDAAPCTFAFSTASQTYDAAGGYGFVGVGAVRPTCSWSVASNNADWLVITDRGAGTGNGIVNFHVGVNAGPQRTGSLSIGDQTFWIIQKQP
jgi:trimeric autotransporter adhesin